MGRPSHKTRDLYAAQLMDKYLKNYDIYPQKPKLQKAKKSLLEQVSKSEMLDQVIIEDEEILISNTVKSYNISKEYLDELYKDNEEIVEIEEEFPITPTKNKKKLGSKKRSRNISRHN
jgi:hypothetical protein